MESGTGTPILELDNAQGNIYCCKHCRTHLALAVDIISKGFYCQNGKAYLFDKVPFPSVLSSSGLRNRLPRRVLARRRHKPRRTPPLPRDVVTVGSRACFLSVLSPLHARCAHQSTVLPILYRFLYRACPFHRSTQRRREGGSSSSDQGQCSPVLAPFIGARNGGGREAVLRRIRDATRSPTLSDGSSIIQEEGMTNLSMESLSEYHEIARKMFGSEEEGFKFYNNYALEKGFSVRRSYVEWDKGNHQLILRKFVCSRQGFCEAKHMKRENREMKPRNITRAKRAKVLVSYAYLLTALSLNLRAV